MEQESITRLKLLHPAIRNDALDAYSDAVQKTPNNIHPFITQTLRTFAESDYLYSLGRTVVNRSGKSSSKPFGNIVTNAQAGQSYHNYGLACFSDDTEILTDDGFKLISRLNKTERVAAFKDGVIKWESPNAYISNYYYGEMVRIKTRSVDQLITPNHKCIVQKRNRRAEWEDGWRPILASKINSQYRIPTSCEKWVPEKKSCKIPRPFSFTNHAKSSYQDVSILDEQDFPFSNIMTAETWWEFMGWYLSEGASTGSDTNEQKKHTSRFKVSIYQSLNSSVRWKLKNCLERTGFVFNENNYGFHIHSKELWSILHPLGNAYSKYIERYLLEADKELLEKLYIALIDGDGCYYEKHETYYSVSKRLVDGFCELCLRLNKSCSISERFNPAGSIVMPHGIPLQSDSLTYEVLTRSRIKQELRNGAGVPRITREGYEGTVYCVSTDSGAVVIRRNGKISISGNCDFVIWDDGQDDWVVDNNWMIVVECFKRKGFSWGGDWGGNIVDNPHLEKKGNYNWRDLLIKYNNKDFIVGTEYVNIEI